MDARLRVERMRYRVSAAAEALDCSPSHVERLLRDGRLRCHQDWPGGDRFISRAEIERYLAEREEAGIRPKAS